MRRFCSSGGAEERMSERMPVMQTDIPADGSFHSKDKCYITAAALTSNNSCRLSWGGMKWTVRDFEWTATVLFFMHSRQNRIKNNWKTTEREVWTPPVKTKQIYRVSEIKSNFRGKSKKGIAYVRGAWWRWQCPALETSGVLSTSSDYNWLLSARPRNMMHLNPSGRSKLTIHRGHAPSVPANTILWTISLCWNQQG